MRILAVLCVLGVLALCAGASPRAYTSPTLTPNDPLFALDQGYLADVHAPAAWDRQSGDPGVLVAVLDSGVAIDHPDLVANIWANPAPGDCGLDLHGCNFLPAEFSSPRCPATAPAGTPDVSPTSWRGTFVAGVIGAAGNNGQGIAGVAWRVAIMPVRVADCHGEADATATVNALHYAVDHGARVVYLGVGLSRSTGGVCRAPNRLLADAVQYARDRGALVVAATGNDNRGCVDDPAADAGALAVAGYERPSHARWVSGRQSGSNWGPEVAVAAPANDIAGTVPSGTDARHPDDLYELSSGTSFSAAIVAGEAALLLSQNPLLTPDWLETLIEKGATPVAGGPAGWAGAGRIDLAASMNLVPAGYSGTAYVGGEAAPDGTPVEAYVNGTLCAQSTTFSGAARATYLLFVPVAVMQPGCGTPGASADLYLDGVAAGSVPWRPAATSLDLEVRPTPQ
jgi:subtilisin family serine protease